MSSDAEIPSVAIPDTKTYHVLGSTDVELASGELRLFEHRDPIETEASNIAADVEKEADGEGRVLNKADEAPILTLQVGKAAWHLHRTTVFGTIADDETVYVFSPPLGKHGGYVKVALPPGVKDTGSALSILQEQFEKILISHGLLKEGIEAVGDELGRSVREDGAAAAHRVQEATKEYLRENPPTTQQTTFSETTHNVSAGTHSASETVLNAASTVSSTVGSAASAAGAWLTKQFVPTDREATETLNTVRNAYDAATGGISGGAGELKSAVTNGAGSVVENDLGPEARDVLGNGASSVGNVAGVVGQATAVASGKTIAIGGLKGAVAMENKQQVEKDQREGVLDGAD